MRKPLTEGEVERIIRRTFAQLEGRNMMSRELITRDGGPSRVAANIQVALAQGRIAANEVERWEKHYESAGYEQATQDLLARPAARNVAPPKSYSEAAWDAYAKATWVNPPSGYSRSVV